MKYLSLLAALATGAFAHGIDLAHEHPGDVFHGISKGVGCNAEVLTDVEPSGRMEDIGDGLQAYITAPRRRKQPDTAVIYLSDIFGLPLVNNKLLADSIAKAGFFVVFPDLFDGDAVPVNAMGSPSFNMTAWRARHPVSAIDAIVTATIAAVSETYNFTDIGAVGYCFGGKYVARFLAEDGGLSAGFMAHPSGITADELDAIANPVSIAYADNDNSNTPQNRSVAAQTFNETGVVWQQTVYSGTSHGFAVRANLSDPQQKFAQESAYLQAIRWLDSWGSA